MCKCELSRTFLRRLNKKLKASVTFGVGDGKWQLSRLGMGWEGDSHSIPFLSFWYLNHENSLTTPQKKKNQVEGKKCSSLLP